MSGEIRDDSPGPGHEKCVTFSTYLWAGLGFRVPAPSFNISPSGKAGGWEELPREFGNIGGGAAGFPNSEIWSLIPRAPIYKYLTRCPWRLGDLETWRFGGLGDLRT